MLRRLQASRINHVNQFAASCARFSQCARQLEQKTPSNPTSRRIKIPLPRPQPKHEPSIPKPPEPFESTYLARLLYDRTFPRNQRARNRLLYFCLLSPILALAMLHAPFEITTVSGPSMSPTFNAEYNPDTDLPSSHKDKVLVQKSILFDFTSNTRRRRERGEDVESSFFSRGDIVTFYTPHSPDKVAVKRIVALPGDIVYPLDGYPGGDETVVVPWNHVWVEGDVNSRQKSIDSNWYGPISQNLIIGRVKAILTPWYSPRWVTTKSHTWPAQRKGRVEEDVVREASVNPDAVAKDQAWTNGKNEKLLRKMRDDSERLLVSFKTNKNMQKEARDLYRNAAMVIAAGNPDSEKYELAQDIIEEMNRIYGRSIMMQGMIRKDQARVVSGERSLEAQQKEPLENKEAAQVAERALEEQGWTIDRDVSGKVITVLPQGE